MQSASRSSIFRPKPASPDECRLSKGNDNHNKNVASSILLTPRFPSSTQIPYTPKSRNNISGRSHDDDCSLLSCPSSGVGEEPGEPGCQRRYVSIVGEAAYPSNGQPCLAMPTFDDEDDDLIDRHAPTLCPSPAGPHPTGCSPWPGLASRFSSKIEFDEFY